MSLQSVGVPRETKDKEFRVGLVPDGARTLAEAGHRVLVERGAGEGSGFDDAAYQKAGATLVDTETAWSEPDVVVKVKEPNASEVDWLSSEQTLFTYLHLAAAPELTDSLREIGLRAVAYETIREPDGAFPVLAPMSEVAGRLAVQIGAHLLQKDQGGQGLLLGGVPGVIRGRVTVIGAGAVGINAVRVATALGAEVDVLDVDLKRLTYLYDLFRGELNTLYSNATNVARSVRSSDLVIGAVYMHGQRAPKLVSEADIEAMRPGSVVVDVAVDQGGCIETIHPTTHSDPTYTVHDVIHYGVANMPGAVPRTSTFALTNATFPYLQAIVAKGVDQAVRDDAALALGANVWRGAVGRIAAESVLEKHGPCAGGKPRRFEGSALSIERVDAAEPIVRVKKSHPCGEQSFVDRTLQSSGRLFVQVNFNAVDRPTLRRPRNDGLPHGRAIRRTVDDDCTNALFGFFQNESAVCARERLPDGCAVDGHANAHRRPVRVLCDRAYKKRSRCVDDPPMHLQSTLLFVEDDGTDIE